MSQNTYSLLCQAAELRAVGYTWEFIAERLHRKARTCQKWPTRFRAEWATIYSATQLRRFEETSNEAHSRLKALMRDDDKRIQHKAIELWTKCAATAYGQGGVLTTAPTSPDDEKIQDALNQVEHLGQFKKGLLRVRANMDKDRAGLGLPPLTDEEFFCERARREYENARLQLNQQFRNSSDWNGEPEPLPELPRTRGEGIAFAPVYALLIAEAVLVGLTAKNAAEPEARRAGDARMIMTAAPGDVASGLAEETMPLPFGAEPRLLTSHPVTHPMQAAAPVLPDRLPAYPSRVSMTFPVRLAALTLGSAILCAAPLAAHPIVPGFERFPANADGGQLLLGELNCVSCHASDGQAKKQAPVLDNIGARARVSHLRKFLADPQATKPGTTMPNLFADDPDRAAKVEALVHFLATTGATKQVRPDLKAVIRGRDTFAKIGCAACHGPRDASGALAKQSFAFAVPLGDVKGKYTIPALTAFLSNPLQTRPSGRMPYLLKANEAIDVAHYLLQGVKSGLPTGKGTTKYAYYEGEWEKLPDFSTMKPKATGTGVAFELEVARRASNYALRFEGVFPAEAAGGYTFTLSSDDGSRLLIDGKKVVDVDGVHPTQSGSGKIELTKGVHKITVEYFQGGGEAVLDVEVESRSLGRQPLAPLVAATEADLVKKVVPKADPKDEDALTIDPDLVTKGKALFASAGCASCHNLKTGSMLIASTAKANPLGMLKTEGGCLAEAPKLGLPRYDLSPAQRKAIAAAIATPQAAGGKPQEVIAKTMLTFNCYACHVRDKIGGPTETTSGVFTTTTPEMGEEGRVPPPLDGVGAKLNADYMKQILDKGADDRPYMHTSMPGFGQPNVGHLPALFAAIDKLPVVPPTKFTETEAKVVQAGRHMVGAQAFGCIKCHTFAGNKAEGVQGIDMRLMTKRLQRDWFQAYCVDPQKIRPGTRMPTAWPNGQSVLPNILDGNAQTQIDAIWDYLAAKNAPIPVGMGRKFMPLIPTDEAIIYRNFIEGAGNRAIAVGYPEKLNLAFDANAIRLAMIWKGGFIDAARHWTDRGTGAEPPLGDDVLSMPAGPGFAVLAKADAAWPNFNPRENGQKFLGYSLTKDERPTFRYSVNGAMIEDFPNPSGKKDPTFRRTIQVTSATPVDGLTFRAAVGAKIEAAGDGWFKVDGWKVRIDGAKAIIRQSGGKAELLVPIHVVDGKAKFTQEFAW